MKTLLSEICDINPKAPAIQPNLEVSFIAMSNVSEKGDIDTSNIRIASQVNKGYTAFQEGDVLMAKITPCMENGKGAVAKGLRNEIGYGSTEFHVLRPHSNTVRSEWLYYYTARKKFRQECQKNMTGSAGQKRVPATYLKQCITNLPPLDEQDAKIGILYKISSIITHYESAFLKLDELVKSQFIEMFGDVNTNPCKWQMTTLSKVVDSIVAGECLNGEQRELRPGERAVLKVSAVTSGYFRPSEYKVLHDAGCVKKNITPSKGDLLFSRANTRELVGATAIVGEDYPHLLLPDKLWKLIHSSAVHTVFLKEYLSVPDVRTSLSASATGTSGSMYNISMPKLLSQAIYLPPLSLQNRFAEFVQQVDKSKFAIRKSLEKTQLLFDSLMQEYFG